MSLREIVAQAFEAAGARQGIVIVVAENVTIVAGDNVPDLAHMDFIEKAREAEAKEAAALAAKLKGHPQVVDLAEEANPEVEPKQGEESWQTPGAEEKLLAAIYAIKGNLTQPKLVEFALANGFTKAAADRLWGTMFHDEEFNKFLAERSVPLERGKNGESLLMKSVRKAAALEELSPGCVLRFGERQYELLLTLVAV